MSALARRCSRFLPHTVNIPNCLVHSRLTSKTPTFTSFFNTTSLLNSSKNAHPKPSSTVKVLKRKSTPSSSTSISVPQHSAIAASTSLKSARASYINDLASRSTTTTLYSSPSQKLYRGLSYSSALFCFVYAANSYDAVLVNAPNELHWLVTCGYQGIVLFMICTGFWFLFGPNRLVKDIIAVPVAISRYKAKKEKLLIEVHLKTILPDFVGRALKPITPKALRPILPQSCIVVSPGALKLDHSLTPYFGTSRGPVQTAKERAVSRREGAAQAAIDAEREKKWKRNILTRPFQKIRHALPAFWHMSRRIFTREGFIKMRVNNRAVKLDVAGAWVPTEGGRACLDRLCNMK